MKYRIVYLETALFDVRELRYVIQEIYKSPVTAERYVLGLADEIKRLSILAESLPIQSIEGLMRYGQAVRRLNYKKMAVIYTVHDDLVYIHRIIPASVITSSSD